MLAVEAMGFGVEKTGPLDVTLIVVPPTVVVDPEVPWSVSVTSTV